MPFVVLVDNDLVNLVDDIPILGAVALANQAAAQFRNREAIGFFFFSFFSFSFKAPA